jgi:hypothetical protein
LDFSALDFDALNRAGVEYIRTYFPNEFNDFFASNGAIMMLELVSYIGAVLSQRADILIDEAFLSTAQTKEAVIQHLELINQKIQRATPAVVDVEISLSGPAPTEVRIAAGTRFSLTGPDQRPLYFEIFRSPGDFTSFISIPPGKRGVIAYGVEGFTSEPLVVTSAGGANQTIDINFSDVLDLPIDVEVQSGDTRRQWSRVDLIETAQPNDEVFEVRHTGTKTRIIFGDDKTGKAPLAGQSISVVYRRGGGIRGRIGASIINETRAVNPQPPISAAVEALFRNLSPSSGGTDEETLEQAKRRAPRQFATNENAVTGEDYGLLASQFRHPIFGAVAKAIAIARTGVDQDFATVVQQVKNAPTEEAAIDYLKDNFVNRNIIELYVLADGPNNSLTTPSSGLKQGLIQMLSEINVLTDEVRVYSGAVKPVDVTALIVLSRNADAGTTKTAVSDAIKKFFDLRNFDMGTGLYLSSLYSVIQSVPGVKFVDLYAPDDDILQTNKVADPTVKGVGFNEVLVLGNLDLSYYFEAGNFRVPPPNKI